MSPLVYSALEHCIAMVDLVSCTSMDDCTLYKALISHDNYHFNQREKERQVI